MSTPRKLKCTIEQITSHGDHVYTVDLKPERPVPAFRPGQFLHLTLDDYDPAGFWPESRVFSIASSPVEKNPLTVIYSVKGKYTARMEHELCEKKEVWIKLPYGEFVVDGAFDAVMIAGGTGITAFQAFIEGLSPEHSRKVILLYGARRPGLLLGRTKIEEKTQVVPRLRAFYFVETDSSTSSAPRERLQDAPLGVEEGQEVLPGVLRGRVSLDVLKACPVGESALWYLAGPPSMVAALSNGLVQRGVAGHSIRIDAWE